MGSGQFATTNEGTAVANELFIDIVDCGHGGYVLFEGSAAQLEAEELIPAGFEYPPLAREVCWTSRGFEYTLCRRRPRRWKGPMRSWLALDHWVLRMDVEGKVLPRWPGVDDQLRRHGIGRRADLNTPVAGLAAARADKGFRAFLGLLPGLSRADAAGRRTARQ